MLRSILRNPLLYCYPTEILPFAIRDKGLSMQIAVSQAALTINQYVNPIALDNIGYYYFIFYLGMLLLGVSFRPIFTDLILIALRSQSFTSPSRNPRQD